MSDKPIDRHDRQLLSLMSDTRFEFTKGSRMERRAYDLSLRGLVERKMQPYRQDFSKGTVEMRYGYRRTDAGRKAVAS